MATDPRGAFGTFAYWLDQPDWVDFSDSWYPGAQSTEGYAPGYYTDNSGTFDQFFERAVLGGLAAISGGAAAEAFGGAFGGGGELVATGDEFFPPPDVGRTSPLVQAGARVATAAAVKAGLPAPLARLIGRRAMDDDWGYDTDTGDVWSQIEGAAGDVIRDYGGQLPSIFTGGAGGSVTPTGAMGGAALAGAGAIGRSLWSVLRAGGARFSTFISATGVRARLSDLWPAVRKYGPQAVATALGIGLAELGTLLTQAPTAPRRRRGRGISAADIRRAKRVIRFNKRLSRELGTNRGYRRSYRPRRRYGY